MDENTTIECHGCHQPVEPQDAMPLEFVERNGTPYTVVFHRPPKQCSLDFAQASIEKSAGVWVEMDEILAKAIQELRKINEQL